MNIQIIRNRRAADSWRHLATLGYEVNPATGRVWGRGDTGADHARREA
jgi:hypothetical protein